jgi:hypothetical protein
MVTTDQQHPVLARVLLLLLLLMVMVMRRILGMTHSSR